MFIAFLMYVFTQLSGNQIRQEGGKIPFHEEDSISPSKDFANLGAEFGE